MAYEKEVKTQKLVGFAQEQVRRLYSFSRGEGSDKVDKVSAFPPYENLDSLKVGETYTYEQENVPMGPESPNKFFHNFTRKNGSYGKNANGPFKIESGEIEAYVDAPDKSKPSTPMPKPTIIEEGVKIVLALLN